MINNVRCKTLSVSNLKAAVDFYEKTLELNKKYEYPFHAGFQCGGIEIGLKPSKKEKKYIEGVPSIEFFVVNVGVVYETLKKDVNFVKGPYDEPWGGREASFLDLDGNLLEIVQINREKYFEVSVKGTKTQCDNYD